MPDEPHKNLTPWRLDCQGSLQASGHSRRYLARFIQAGRVRARGGGEGLVEIPAQVLEQAAAEKLFDQRAVFLDHAGFLQPPSLGQLIGMTGAAHYDPAAQAVQGEISFLDNPAAQHALSLIQAQLENPSLDIGFSLAFYPEWAPSPSRNGASLAQPRRLSAIRFIESIDLVFQPAAGGRILQPLAAGEPPSTSSQGEKNTMPTNPNPNKPGKETEAVQTVSPEGVSTLATATQMIVEPPKERPQNAPTAPRPRRGKPRRPLVERHAPGCQPDSIGGFGAASHLPTASGRPGLRQPG